MYIYICITIYLCIAYVVHRISVSKLSCWSDAFKFPDGHQQFLHLWWWDEPCRCGIVPGVSTLVWIECGASTLVWIECGVSTLVWIECGVSTLVWMVHGVGTLYRWRIGWILRYDWCLRLVQSNPVISRAVNSWKSVSRACTLDPKF